jgi:hypothetical protein
LALSAGQRPSLGGAEWVTYQRWQGLPRKAEVESKYFIETLFGKKTLVLLQLLHCNIKLTKRELLLLSLKFRTLAFLLPRPGL